MSVPATATVRHFLTYRGMSLPLTLVEELDLQALRHRNTFLRAGYDEAGRLLWVEKLVYGEVEMRHDYRWRNDGTLAGATLHSADEEPREVELPSP